jgi:hypothetical protein
MNAIFTSRQIRMLTFEMGQTQTHGNHGRRANAGRLEDATLFGTSGRNPETQARSNTSLE